MAKGRQPGIPNYKNHILIPIVEKQLPTDAEGWAVVAGLYKEASGELILRDRADLRSHWFKKLCHSNKGPTDRKSDHKDYSLRCIQIQRAIMDQANSHLLGGECSGASDEVGDKTGGDQGNVSGDEDDKNDTEVEHEDQKKDEDVISNSGKSVDEKLNSKNDDEEKSGLTSVNPPAVAASTSHGTSASTAGIMLGASSKKTKEKTKDSSIKNYEAAFRTKPVQQLSALMENENSTGRDMMMQMMQQQLQMYQQQQQLIQIQQINERMDKMEKLMVKLVRKAKKSKKRKKKQKKTGRAGKAKKIEGKEDSTELSNEKNEMSSSSSSRSSSSSDSESDGSSDSE